MTRTKTFLVVAAALFLTTSLFAQKPLENSLLWRISGKGLKQPSYLYGTMHLLCMQDFVLRGQTIEAMNTCKRIAFEFDFFNTQEMVKMSQMLVNNDPNAYKRWLGEKDYRRLQHFMASSPPVPDSVWTKARPMQLTRLITRKMLNCTKTGAEQVVLIVSGRDNEKRGYKHEMGGLEAADDWEQLNIFPKTQDSLLARQVIKEISHWARFKSMVQQMILKYKAENITEIIGVSDVPSGKSVLEIHRESVIVAGRNKLWLPRIEKMALEKPTFFAVGAGHLGGKNGIITLLRKQGYNVEPITKREQVLGIKK